MGLVHSDCAICSDLDQMSRSRAMAQKTKSSTGANVSSFTTAPHRGACGLCQRETSALKRRCGGRETGIQRSEFIGAILVEGEPPTESMLLHKDSHLDCPSAHSFAEFEASDERSAQQGHTPASTSSILSFVSRVMRGKHRIRS